MNLDDAPFTEEQTAWLSRFLEKGKEKEKEKDTSAASGQPGNSSVLSGERGWGVIRCTVE